MKIIRRIWSLITDKSKKFWRWYKALYRGKKWYTKLGIGFASFIVAIFVWLIAVDLNLFWLFGGSPGFIGGGMDLQPSQASEIYSADGKLLGKFYNENRTPVKYEEITPLFFKALIDTEDERFYTHWGVDPIGIVGAAKDAATGKGGRGASTITQQLAKNLFRTRSGGYSNGLLGYIPGLRMGIQKSKEWIIATKLEISHSKDEILTLYANTVDFGSNAFGIKTAAKTYFGTTPDKLKVEECAVLVGMLKATTYYSPLSNPENSLRRRNQVLENMVTHGDLSRKMCDSLQAIPIHLKYSVENPNDGTAHYFRNAILDDDALKAWREANGYDFYTDGLKIYTTVDSKMQQYAEKAVAKQMRQVQRNFDEHWRGQDPWRDENGNEIPGFIMGIAKKQPVYKNLEARFPHNPDSIDYYLNKVHKVKLFDYDAKNYTIEREMSTMDSIRYMVRFMHCGFIAMEPQTGYVKAWVGDINFNHWKYDKVTAMRQPGSTFKLFVYTEAMQQGLTPCDVRRDVGKTYNVYDKKRKEYTDWTPHNANGHFTGDSIPLKSAFARSINSIAVGLGQEVGIDNIINTAHSMGIKSPLDSTPSLALGSSDVNLLEMAAAYSCIADYGKAHEPVLVYKIEDRDGNVIYQADTEGHQEIRVKSAYLMQKMLMGGLSEAGGTSQAMWGYIDGARDTDWGGKTGTTNNHSDAWYMCVTPKLVCGAWVGGEYRSIHFRTGALGQGSRTALPICGYFMQSVMSDSSFSKYHGRFNRPDDPDIVAAMYDCPGYVEHDNDSTEVDSLALINEEEFLNEITDEQLHDIDTRQQNTNKPQQSQPRNSNTNGTNETFEIEGF